MDIKKADYEMVIQFGDLELLKEKMELEADSINDILNNVSERGISFLQMALARGKYDIAKYFLDNGAKINIISKENMNELHYISGRINQEGGIELANKLLDLGVDLDLKDKQLNNSALCYLIYEVFKKRNDKGMDFIIKCLKKTKDITSKNMAGYSIYDIIQARGTEEMKTMVEEIL